MLYLSVSDVVALGSVLAQYDDHGKERVIYYLSKKMLDYELKYTAIEKTCLALVWVIEKLKHYVSIYSVWLISCMDPIKYLFEKPALVGKMPRWSFLIAPYDIKFVVQKSVKGQIIADHLSAHRILDKQVVVDEFPNEDIVMVEEGSLTWKMYFDGTSNSLGHGIGTLLISSDGDVIPRAIRLVFRNNWPVTNNVSEYEACIMGLETAIELGIKRLVVFGDSNLVLQQIQGKWKTRDPKLRPYHAYLELLVGKFENITYCHLPRDENHLVDSLASLASMLHIPEGAVIRLFLVEKRTEPAYLHIMEIMELSSDDKPWYTDIYQLLRNNEYPECATKKDKRTLHQLASIFVICGDTLYRKSTEGILLLCLDELSAEKVINKVHGGQCGTHMSGHMSARKIMRLGYFLLTMETDCCKHVRGCHECQIHGNLNHIPPSELHYLTRPWPFSVWGIDIIGKITPKASNDHEYILVVIDYFMKWVEAASYAKLTSVEVSKFIKLNTICRYGVPHELIFDQGSHFKKEVSTLLAK